MSRRYGKVRPKRNRVYGAEVIQRLYDVCRNTLTNWTKAGLPPIDEGRPQLFRGAELDRFHADRSQRTHRPLRTGEFKCFRCGLRVVPDVQTVKVEQGRTGPLARATCPECSGRLFRSLSATALDAYLACLETNTSLHTLHEENGRAQAGIGTSGPVEWPCWNPENERVIFLYQDYCGRYAPVTEDAHLASIRDFEAFTGLKSFRQIKPADAARFREDLARRGREGASRSGITHRASQLSLFFKWLVQQDGYRQLNHSIPEYFVLSRRDAAEAVKSGSSEVVPMDVIEGVLDAMPIADLIDRRDRAIVAATCLFGTRADATASLFVGDVDVERRITLQDGTRMRVKNSKSQVTAWFPASASTERIVVEWIAELRRLGFGDCDALFPPNKALIAPRPNRKPIQPWATDDGVRRAFGRGCTAAGTAYINPHAVRHAPWALGRDCCHSVEEQMAWSHNMGHSDLRTTLSHYAQMTDARRDAIFDKMRQRDPASEDDKDLLLRYHEHELSPGTLEFERAAELHLKRMEKRKRGRTGT